ncbi:uncharacterized protein LOC135207783 [Macrobrachium nipponense]|uniref:uncharacterized protein LOC135207783 n=1 Tax=Macrobrachium nipponense TaxID=159736 RepID=UPI0030C8B792
MYELDQELCEPDNINGLFRVIAAHFYDCDCNDLPALAFRLHGGTPERDLSKASHVIITNSDKLTLRPSELAGQHLVVTSDWIYDCIEKRKLLEARHMHRHRFLGFLRTCTCFGHLVLVILGMGLLCVISYFCGVRAVHCN